MQPRSSSSKRFHNRQNGWGHLRHKSGSSGPTVYRALDGVFNQKGQSCEFSQKAVGAETFGLLAHRQRSGSLHPMNRVTAELIAITIVILLVAVTLGWALFDRRG